MSTMTSLQALQRAQQLVGLGQLSQAEAICRQVLQAEPDNSGAVYMLGIVALYSSRAPQAIDLIGRAYQVDPRNTQYLGSLAAALQLAGRFADAIDIARKAVQINPTQAESWYNLGVSLHTQPDVRPAIDAYRKAIELNPNHAKALANLSAALWAVDQPGNAESFARRALAIHPNNSAAHNALATALAFQGRVEESINSFEKAVELLPQNADLHGQLLHTMLHLPDISGEQMYQQHLNWAARHAAKLNRGVAYSNGPDPNRKLRIGYVSQHFIQHAVAYFSAPMLAAHDREKFEIVCYHSAAIEDGVTARFKQSADLWRNIANKNNEEAAEIIRQDRIDMLVDLSGHLRGNRLLIFAQKPAPIQVSYLGYQTTTGLAAMDYRLTDAIADPPELQTDRFYTEKLVRLPLFFTYEPFSDAPPVGPLPARSMNGGKITFGSMNHPVKVTAKVRDAWTEILRALPEAWLLFLVPGGETGGNDHTRRSFAERGISGDRIELVAMCPVREYFALYQRLDLSLDPFPFTGHTTTCDSLWMGVPTVTLAGEDYRSRMGASVMEAIGCPQWIAHSPQEYAEKIIALARDLDGLENIRGQLRSRMSNSSICDAQQFTRHAEQAYRRMWVEWCDVNRQGKMP